MITLNGVYYKQNAVEIWQIILNIFSAKVFSPQTNLDRIALEFVWWCFSRWIVSSLLTNYNVNTEHYAPFIYNVVYVKRPL